MKRIINIFLIIILCFSTYKLVMKIYDYYKGQTIYKGLQKYNTISDKDENKNYNKDIEKIITDKKEEEEKEKQLKEINSSYKLWMKISGTNIDYPVVQGKNNSYYLTHDYEGNKNSSGCIFIDYRNDINKDKNLILYGHNMKNNTMFAQLQKFKNKNFFNANRYIYIKEGFNEYKYKIFAVCVTDSKSDYLKNLFNNYDDFKGYIDRIKKDSLIYENIDVNKNSKIITLSTCNYDVKGNRMVVYGELLKDSV